MTKKVFISYSHDSDEHRIFVHSLSDKLRDNGLDCQIDQYLNGFPLEGWQRWMETQIEQADFVLIVCTSLYLKRFRGLDEESGHGVNFEGVVISQTLYDHYFRNIKFIPVIPDYGCTNNVPLPLKAYSTYTLPRDYTKLYRVLTEQPATPAPKIGRQVKLEPEQVQRFASSSTNKPKQPTQVVNAKKIKAKVTMEEGFIYVGFGLRLLAMFLDFVVLFAIFVVSIVIVTAAGGEVSAPKEETPTLVVFDMFLFSFQWIYFTGMESLKYQGTFGKRVLGIKVINLKGEKISFLMANWRFLAKVFSVGIFMIGFLLILFNKKKRGLHDVVAGTFVVKYK